MSRRTYKRIARRPPHTRGPVGDAAYYLRFRSDHWLTRSGGLSPALMHAKEFPTREAADQAAKDGGATPDTYTPVIYSRDYYQRLVNAERVRGINRFSIVRRPVWYVDSHTVESFDTEEDGYELLRRPPDAIGTYLVADDGLEWLADERLRNKELPK